MSERSERIMEPRPCWRRAQRGVGMSERSERIMGSGAAGDERSEELA
ncbi:hypothetical protein [Catellatospora paridis]|nr:hypothetical protein [Catellatospora paridis]